MNKDKPINIKNTSNINVHYRVPSSQTKNEFHQNSSQNPTVQKSINNSGSTKNNAVTNNFTEKNLKIKLNEEYKKTQSLKKQIHDRNKQKLRNYFSIYSVCLTLALFISIVYAVFSVLIYYRSVTKYKSNNIEYSVECYDFIDENDTSDENLKRIEERKKGIEKPCINLNTYILIKDSIPYIPFSAIEKYMNISIAGNENVRTIISGASNTDFNGFNTADFTLGSNEVKINDTVHLLSGESFIENNDFYFPLEFIETFVSGIKIDKSSDNKKNYISIYKLGNNVVFGGTSISPSSQPVISMYLSNFENIPFNAAESSYLNYTETESEDRFLLLVNNTSLLSPDYIPEELKTVKSLISRPGQKTISEASVALNAMLQAAEAAGFNSLAVYCGYRSYSDQEALYTYNQSINEDISKSGIITDINDLAVIPGSSEHQSGLAVDIIDTQKPMQTFANSDGYKWLIENCSDFGYILRYPQGKEQETGRKYEPWHFRYVGVKNAKTIMSEGITLEEYLSKK